MKIGGVTDSSNAMPAGSLSGRETDAETKRIQSEIKEVQKQIQKLAENDEMSPEEKMKKKQELNKKITDLNNQLRQHQMEVRKEKQQENNTMDKMLGNKQENEKEVNERAGSDKLSAGMSQSGMKSIISAGFAMDQAAVYESTATNLDGRANVLKTEIELDGGSGRSAKAKEDELASVQQKAGQARGKQVETLAQAGKDMQAEASQTSDEKKASDLSGNKTEEEEKASKEEQENKEREEQQQEKMKAYKAIDILL